jgi:hypothetical protein
MNWADAVFFAFTGVGVVAFCLMAAAYGIAFRHRGRGRRAKLVRGLMLTGASLGVVFGLGLTVCLALVGAPWDR